MTTGYLAPGTTVRVGSDGPPSDNSPIGVIDQYKFETQQYAVRLTDSGGIIVRPAHMLARISS